MNITYGYKNSFNDLNLTINMKKVGIDENNDNATSHIYMQKEAFEKILEKEVKLINKSKYPLLFEELQKRGENISDIFIKDNVEKIAENSENNKNCEENEEEKENVFKFFEGHEKKTENEIDNMNKDQLINYSKKFLRRVNEIETYLDKYIQYKKGYKLSEEDELKINDYNSKLYKANELLQEITAKYNKSKIFIEKNNSIIDQLNKENILLKQKLNDKITLEKLTYPSFMNMTQNNDVINKKKIKQDLVDFGSHTIATKTRKDKTKYFSLDHENKKIYSNLTLTQSNRKRPDSYRCTTYSNKNYIKKAKKVSFSENKTMRPFSSFQKIKSMEKKQI